MSVRLAGAAILVIAALYVWLARGYTASFGDVLGPSVFPTMVGIAAIALSASLVLFPGGAVSWPSGSRMVRQACALAALIGYAVLLKPLGFPLATALLIIAVTLVLEGPPLTAVIIGVVGALSLWALFDQILGLPLAFLGRWFG